MRKQIISKLTRRGVTLIEVLLFSSIAVGVLLWVGPWLSKPTRIQQKMQATLEERRALQATDLLVNDLKQMIPGSLLLDPSKDQGPLDFQTSGEATPEGEWPGMPVPIRYVYHQQTPQSDGSLYRIVNGSSTVVLNGLLVPTPDNPLFRNDPTLRILIIDLRLRTANTPTLRLVRRVSLPN